MKAKKKICDGCSCEKIIWKNHEGKKYCKHCWSAHSTSQQKPTVRKKLALVSQKRLVQQKEYSEKRKIFLEKNLMCKARLNGCALRSTDVHHMKGRAGELYLDETYWLALCRQCHSWAELNPLQAREMGLSLTKH